MRKINITKDTITNAAKVCGMVAIYGVALATSNASVKDIIDKVRYSGNVKYSDAVSVIMDSSMFSSDKTRVIDVVKKDGDVEYYRAVIQIVKSSMFSSDKVKTIVNLCKDEEES